MPIYRRPLRPDELQHHGVKGQHWGVKNGPPYPLDSSISTGKKLKEEPDFDPYEAMDRIDRSLSKKERDLLGVGNDNSDTPVEKFFFDKNLTAYLIATDYHGKYKDEHPIPGKILGIAAKKETRGTGATDKLISNAKKFYKNDRLVAEIDKKNIASERLFKRNGFKKKYEDDYINYYIWERKAK